MSDNNDLPADDRNISGNPDQPDEQAVDWGNPATWPKEFGGSKGPEPTRYGDWERNGRCSDF